MEGTRERTMEETIMQKQTSGERQKRNEEYRYGKREKKTHRTSLSHTHTHTGQASKKREEQSEGEAREVRKHSSS